MTSSFIIVDRRTGKPVLETFNHAFARAINRDNYDVVPVAKWLASLNQGASA